MSKEELIKRLLLITIHQWGMDVEDEDDDGGYIYAYDLLELIKESKE